MKWVDKIYIISLERHENRRRQIFADLNSAGFDVSKIEWIHAIDGSKLNIDELIENETINPTFRDPQGVLTKSVYGCALSHKKAYETFLKTSDDVKTALILEDDASVTHTLLRLYLTKSIAYNKLIEETNSIDWGVIVMGGQYKNIEHHEDSSFVLKRMKQYPINYAAHSYVINKKSAEKLIESNKSIQFAADVNLHCSDVNLYCTPISYFTQKIGNMDKWMLIDLQTKFKFNVLYKQSNWDTEEIISSTTYGDYEFDSSEDSTFLSTGISKQLKIKSVDWDKFTAPNGDVIEDWANIHLKTKTNE